MYHRIFVLLIIAFAWASVSGYRHGRSHRITKRQVLPTCDRQARFRRFDGQCNNLREITFGMAGQPFARMAYPDYGDGQGSPRTLDSVGQPLPSARLVSITCHPPNGVRSDVTLMVMQWGQFLDHDITLTPETPGPDGGELSCECNSTNLGCFNIVVNPNEDNFFNTTDCLPFVRSANIATSGEREQQNAITAFIDASNVYGSSESEARSLRDPTDSSLLKDTSLKSGDFLPEGDDDSCMAKSNEFCFRAGDGRVNEQPGLGTMHTIFLRYHNLLAKKLKKKNRNLSNDRIFEEVRKIIGAIMQQVTYTEFLPVVLGEDTMTEYNLGSVYFYYDRSECPDIINAFATAAFRFGHSLIPEGYLIDQHFHNLENLFFSPSIVLNNLNGMTKTLITEKSMASDGHFVHSITRHLFQTSTQLGSDLVARNIQRGRDHGLPPYNEFRMACNLEPLDYLDELFPNNKPAQEIFNSIDDVDLFTGGMLEQPLAGSLVGPTFACILGRQFSSLKFGDRFFYETRRRTGFTKEQRKAIKEINLNSIICDTTGVSSLQENVFLPESKYNPSKKCQRVRSLNLDPWSGTK